MDLIIVGAGDFGREALQWALQSKENSQSWKIAGFLSDDLTALDGFDCPYPILGTVLNWQPKDSERFVIAIAAPEIKERIVQMLTDKGAIFTNIIHETVVMATTVKLGKGVILCPHVVISDHAIIEDHVAINNHSCIGHDVTVGKYTSINSLCDITGNVTIGEKAFFGSSSCVIPKCHIGDNAYICAGSVIMNNIKAGYRVMGNPAKRFQIRMPNQQH